MADMKQSDDVRSEHRELRPSVIQRSEDSVQRMMNAIESFTNPFSVEPGKLINLSSGAAVPAEVKVDVLCADKIGNEEKETLLKNSWFHLSGNCSTRGQID